MRDGAAGLAIAIGIFVIAVGIMPAIFLNERFRADVESAEMAQKLTLRKQVRTPAQPEKFRERLCDDP